MNRGIVTICQGRSRVGFGILSGFVIIASCFTPGPIAAQAGVIEKSKGGSVGTSARTGYHRVTQYNIGGEGGWDYISIDSQARRLYVAHGSQVEVLDVDSGEVVGQIGNTPGVHGVAIASELNRGFTSNGGDSSVTIFDLKTRQTIKKVQLKSSTDFILYDSFTKRVFPMDERITVLDGESGEVAGIIDLGGEPEAGVSDGSGRVFVNLKNKASIAVIDPKGLNVVEMYPIQNCLSPHSLSYDQQHQRLFVGCQNGFAAVDALTGKLVGWTVIGSGVDASAFDPAHNLIFESCAEGVVSVIHQMSPDYYQLSETILTELWAKTMAFDPKTEKIYLPTAEFEAIPNSNPKSPVPFQQRIKAGTFKVVVLGKN